MGDVKNLVQLIDEELRKIGTFQVSEHTVHDHTTPGIQNNKSQDKSPPTPGSSR